MGPRRDGSVGERLEKLESTVEAQGRELALLNRRLSLLLAGRSGEHADRVNPAGAPSARAPENVATLRGRPPSETEPPERRWRLPERLEGLRSGEWWLNKIGIGLLLLGVAFLFKFSVDQDWITPSVRVGIGLALGVLLVVLGLRVYEDRRAFSQVLLGGGVGVFYITGFAAFRLYALVPYAAVFAFMVAVTVLAFALSIRQSGAALATIGTLGGLGTPFLLYQESAGIGGLVLYTCLLLSGASAVYLYQGWRSLLLVVVGGTWMVFLVGYASLSFSPDVVDRDRLALQLGVAFAWIVLWIVPVVREVLRYREPGRWTLPQYGASRGEETVQSNALAHAVCVSGPLVALAFTQAIWDLEQARLGWISLGAAGLYGFVAWVCRRVERDGTMAYTQAIAGILLGTLALVLILEGNALYFVLAAEAVALHLLARRFSDEVLSLGGDALSLSVIFWLGTRVLGDPLGFGPSFHDLPAVVSLPAVLDLVVIGSILFTAGFVAPLSLARAYRLAAHAALLAWLWRELSGLPDGEAYVTVAWGAYAVVLLVAGLRLDRGWLIRVGMATLFLVVGKLFLVDLAGVGAVWRILLFLGFGGLFLILGYYLQALWRPGGSGTPPDRTGSAGLSP